MMILDRSNNNLKYCSFSSVLYNESVIEACDDLDYPMKNSGVSLRIVGSVNGLICLRTEDLFIWNPTIKKYKKLSSLPTLKNNSYFKYGFGYAFGYDEFHDDYKVVAIYQHGRSSNVEVKIYSLKSDSWRNMDDFEDGARFGKLSQFLNGKLHWTTGNLGKYSCRGPWNIVSIDMADEKWGKVEPPCFGEEDDCCKLGVLGNNLSVLCNTTSRTSVNVWVMKEYGVKESWTKKSIKCINDIERFFNFPCCYMSNKGEILIVSGAPVKRHNRDDAPWAIKKIYNPNDDSIRYAEVTNFFARLSKETYFESLFCPLSQNQQGLSNKEACKSSNELQLCN